MLWSTQTKANSCCFSVIICRHKYCRKAQACLLSLYVQTQKIRCFANAKLQIYWVKSLIFQISKQCVLLYYLQERSIQHSEFWCDSFASCLNYAFLLIFNGSQQHDQRCQLILLKISLVVMRSTSYVKTVVWCLPRLWRELPNVWNNNSDDVIVMTSGLSGLFFNTRSFSTERLCYKLRVNDFLNETCYQIALWEV